MFVFLFGLKKISTKAREKATSFSSKISWEISRCFLYFSPLTLAEHQPYPRLSHGEAYAGLSQFRLHSNVIKWIISSVLVNILNTNGECRHHNFKKIFSHQIVRKLIYFVTSFSYCFVCCFVIKLLTNLVFTLYLLQLWTKPNRLHMELTFPESGSCSFSLQPSHLIVGVNCNQGTYETILFV